MRLAFSIDSKQNCATVHGEVSISDPPMRRDSRSGRFDLNSILSKIDNESGPLPKIDDTPGVVFRRLFDVWVERGGYRKGKPRHSARQIKSWLGNRQVRSLETKLAGKTFLQKQDAAILIRLFLIHWTYNEEADNYSPYSEIDIDDAVDGILKEIFHSENSSILLPLRSRTTQNQNISSKSLDRENAGGNYRSRPSRELIGELFTSSDVLITISRARTIIGTDPVHAMSGFQHSLENLFEISQVDNRRRALIWIVDMGFRENNISSFRSILNIQFLATQFRALALIDADIHLKRWKWLCDHVVVLVGTLSRSEIDASYASAGIEVPSASLDLPQFAGDRLFLESVPGRWIDCPDLEVFGRPQRELWQTPTVTGHLCLDDWEIGHTPEIDPQRNLRYFFHSSIDTPAETRQAQRAQCIELPQPGLRWSNGYRLACNAAFGRLDWGWDKRLSDISPSEALAQLRRQSFAVLRLDEFRRLADLIVDNNTKI